jgi:isoamylase
MFLNGYGIRGMDTRGARVVDDSFLLLFNAHDEALDWVLPPEEFAPAWRLVIDTAGVPEHVDSIHGGTSVRVADKGMVVLQALASVGEEPTPGGAAASVPTIAPVPVSMRPDVEGGHGSDRAPEAAAEHRIVEPEAPAGHSEPAPGPRTDVTPDIGGPTEASPEADQGTEPPAPAKPARAPRTRRPKKN